MNLFAPLTYSENKALFAKLGHAGTAYDEATAAVLGDTSAAAWFDKVMAAWRECNELRSDLLDARFRAPRTVLVPTGTGWPEDGEAQRIAEVFDEADPAHPWEQAIVTGTKKDGTPFAATMIVYVAAAYRTPDDPRPGIGVAWEVFPGRTPYTLGSELMNAETSAWGRAIVAVLASDSKRGVASRQEVAARHAEREDGLPVNADGSLSRSRTSDAEKDAAGVMTAAQQAEHTRLQPKRGRPAERLATTPPTDPWYGTTSGLDGQEHQPGTVSPQQQRAIHAACTGMDRAKRLATIGDIVGRQVGSSNELSYTEAARVLEKLAGARA